MSEDGTVAGEGVEQSTPTFGARTVTPSDPAYQDLIRGVDQRWVGSPESIRLVSTTPQAVRVVREAVSAGKRLTVRSGGHCYEDFVYNDDVEIVLDMSEMNAVYYDDEMRAFVIEAGTNLLDAYDRLYKIWGVVVPAGICYSVGAGGHVAGGGWGSLCRDNGVVVDHLYAVEVVVVGRSGEVRAVVATRENDDPNRDLWWAHTGGGGGSFGVVTRYWFRSPGAAGNNPTRLLPRPPREVFINAFAWQWSDITEQNFARIVRNYTDFQVANASPRTPYRGMSSFLNLNHQSSGQIDVLTIMDATAPNAERLLRDYFAAITRGVGIPAVPVSSATGEHSQLPSDLFEPQPFSWLRGSRDLGTGHERIVNPNLRGDYKSAYHREGFNATQLSALYRHLSSTDLDNPLAVAQFSSFGGQVNAVDRTETAFVHRDSAFKILYELHWTDPADDGVNVRWLRGIYEDVYRSTGGVPVLNEQNDGCYINYCDTDLNDPAHNRSDVPWYTLYWAENYPALQQAKARWDPTDFFRHTQSIRLP